MFKLLIIGNSSVGKTSFLFRYADDSFSNSFVSTVGIDFKVKTVYRNDKRIKLQIWTPIRPPQTTSDPHQTTRDHIRPPETPYEHQRPHMTIRDLIRPPETP
ncbi:unnamed protein product [Menidia menidia]|uniref:small monomeric GTPase n=1 Tax=Menidia menidia TaxID=238744 RepID=A0A8S4A7K8_9TELE|nr:unnamed protein product [Menidia menidia]